MAVAERVAIPAADYFYKHQKERYGCHEVAMLVSYSVLKVPPSLLSIILKYKALAPSMQ